MFLHGMNLKQPGLFVTGTDTAVGKTVVTCAVAWWLRQRGHGVGVCKPFATGCRREREGLVNEDAEALSYFADYRQPLEVINPIRYAPPLAPAVAARETKEPIDFQRLRRCLGLIDESCDAMLVEGVGGLLVPIDESHTVLDVIKELGYPVLVVTRAGLGTLNHTAMTVRLLKQARCRIAGLIINNYPSPASSAILENTGPCRDDPSVSTNPHWLHEMTGVPILAMVPRCAAQDLAPEQGRMPAIIHESIAGTDWLRILRRPKVRTGSNPDPSTT